MLKKQSQTVDKGWSSSLGLGEGLMFIHCKEPPCCEMLSRASELVPVAGSCEHSNDPSVSIKGEESLDWVITSFSKRLCSM
jgi:hypothetical protein